MFGPTQTRAARPRTVSPLPHGVAPGLHQGGNRRAGPGHSAATLADRWAAGEAAMRQALRRLHAPAMATNLAEGLLLHEVEATPTAA
jgi:hypothetical protein